MATKRRAASAGPRTAATRSKKYCWKALGSSVLPDLLATITSVRSRSTRPSSGGDLRRHRRVEDVQLGRAGLASERARQHLGTQAGAAHAEQQRVREAVPADTGGDVLEHGQELPAGVDGAEPAEPPGFVRAGPERRVLVPQPARAAGARPTAAPPCPPDSARAEGPRQACAFTPVAVSLMTRDSISRGRGAGTIRRYGAEDLSGEAQLQPLA